MGLLPRIAHRLGQVAGADKEHIHPGDRYQFLQVVNGLYLLQHQADQGIAVGRLYIIGGVTGKAIAGRAAAAENAPTPLRMILDRIHGGRRLGGGVDMRHLHAPRPPIQKGRDKLRLVADGPDNGRDAAQFGGPHQILGIVHGDGAVFVVQQDPVKA